MKTTKRNVLAGLALTGAALAAIGLWGCAQVAFEAPPVACYTRGLMPAAPGGPLVNAGPAGLQDRFAGPFNTESYDHVVDNAFQRVADHPLSTFSIDVDTASYSNIRRFLTEGQLPPAGAVRIEEMINYFPYAYTPPGASEAPLGIQAEAVACPWAKGHRLVRVAIKGREILADKRPAGNFVFLLDVSGSMDDPHKLPLVKAGLKMLLEHLNDRDRVAIVVYAGASGLAMDSTPCDRRAKIHWAIDTLRPGGSTNGAQGIELAYKIARDNYIQGGINRVILCTDGDFNVGLTSQSDLIDLVQKQASSGVFLTALGFGMGNYKDSTLEKLADKGNGNYAYIDTAREARKVLVDQASGTLVTVAKDVKIQVEFNPSAVGTYRLIGYENRMLRKEDFNDDKKNAGELGAGHTVTALYEIAPPGQGTDSPPVDSLKYQQTPTSSGAPASKDLLTVKCRYKEPDGQASKRLDRTLADEVRPFEAAPEDFRFAVAVAGFGMVLRDSPHKGDCTLASILAMARSARGVDPDGYRAEFIQLVQSAAALKR